MKYRYEGNTIILIVNIQIFESQKYYYNCDFEVSEKNT